ncbi:hypothetical protein ACGFZP_25515 [Kitasatospora sp. NPDC048239]|uniref:hypothetical protein n=1 Tax=Kitasatospora sp. NPDC048239 TaxID=3364046 RepID=UPI00371C502E
MTDTPAGPDLAAFGQPRRTLVFGDGGGSVVGSRMPGGRAKAHVQATLTPLAGTGDAPGRA